MTEQQPIQPIQTKTEARIIEMNALREQVLKRHPEYMNPPGYVAPA
jgi:hypothetical protein